MESPVLLEDIQALLDTLQLPLVSHIRRNAIQVAHLRAHFGFNSKSTRVWIDETLILVLNVVSFDSPH